MTWKKRSPKEIDAAVSNGDYTGGYRFLPWILHMRRWTLFALAFDLFAGISLLSGQWREPDFESIACGLLFGVAIPIGLCLLLVREYREKKQGIAR